MQRDEGWRAARPRPPNDISSALGRGKPTSAARTTRRTAREAYRRFGRVDPFTSDRGHVNRDSDMHHMTNRVMASRFSGHCSSGMQKSENRLGTRRFVKSNRYRAAQVGHSLPPGPAAPTAGAAPGAAAITSTHRVTTTHPTRGRRLNSYQDQSVADCAAQAGHPAAPRHPNPSPAPRAIRASEASCAGLHSALGVGVVCVDDVVDGVPSPCVAIRVGDYPTGNLRDGNRVVFDRVGPHGRIGRVPERQGDGASPGFA
jgi:hypothetical protein